MDKIIKGDSWDSVWNPAYHLVHRMGWKVKKAIHLTWLGKFKIVLFKKG